MKIKNWLRGVRTISLQAKALPGTLILRTLIIHPPMISTLTILKLTISARLVSTHIVSTLTISALRMLQRSIVPPGLGGTTRTLVPTNPKAWQSWHMPPLPHIETLLFVAVVAVEQKPGRLFFGLPPLPRGAFCGVCGIRGSCGIATPIPPIRIHI